MPSETETPPTQPTPAPAPRRARRTTHAFRWSVRLCLGIPLTLLLIVLVTIRSPLVGQIAKGRIKALTGCELSGLGLDSSFIDLDGNLELRNFTLLAPGVPGKAAAFLSADRMVVDLDWSNIWSGKIKAREIRLHNPKFLITQSSTDGTVNIAKLASAAPSATPGTISVPKIDAIDAKVVFGEHDPISGNVQPLQTLNVSGTFMPLDQTRPLYAIRLSERGNASSGKAPDKSLLLDGRIDLAAGSSSIRLYNLALDAWGPEQVPSAYRALWQRLNVQGRIASASLNYDAKTGPRVEVNVERVAMNAPVPVEDPKFGPTQDLALRDVSGAIVFAPSGLKADLRGVIDGRSGQNAITLVTEGTELTSALSLEIIARELNMTKDTAGLPYIPERVKEYFAFFGGPTGLIDVRLIISRGAPQRGEAAPLQVSGGRATLVNGSAAFHRFPYPFQNMNGTIEFDDRFVRIVSLEGDGPTGARLKASGLITPLNDESMVDINVRVDRVPVDEHLLSALSTDRAKVINTIFSQPEYERLVGLGLLRDPKASAAAAATAQPFALAGLANINVHVLSPEGKDMPWYTNIDVHWPECGVLVRSFPIPIRATDVRLKITDDDAKLVSGTFVPISGGSIELSTFVKLFENNEKVVKPDVRVTARDIPVDEFVRQALPAHLRPGTNAEIAALPEVPGLNAPEIFRRLNLSGTLDATAAITEALPHQLGPEGPGVNYDIRVNLHKVSASPAILGSLGPASTFAVEQLQGIVVISPEAVRIDNLTARLFRTRDSEDTAVFMGPLPSADLTLNLVNHLDLAPPEQRGRLSARVGIIDMNLADPIERLVGVFAPPAQNALKRLRTERDPAGRLQSTLHIDRPADASGPTPAKTSFSIRLEKASWIDLVAFGGRLAAESFGGAIIVDLPDDGGQRLRFEDVQARLLLNNRSCGEVEASGWITLDPTSGGVAAPAFLTAKFLDWRFDSPLLAPLLERFSERSTAERYLALDAAGSFDATVRVQSRQATPGDANTARADIVAELSPRSLSFTIKNERIDVLEASGKVTLRALTGSGGTPVHGLLDNIVAKTQNWTAFANGRWSAADSAIAASGLSPAPGASGVSVDLALGLEAEVLDIPLKALLPSAALTALNAIEAKFDGPFALRNSTVKTTFATVDSSSSATATDETNFVGQVVFSNLAFKAGIPVDRCNGVMDIRVRDHDGLGKDAAAFEVALSAESLRLSGVQATGARAVIRSTETPGEIQIADVSAFAHGGRATGEIRGQLPSENSTEVTPEPASADGMQYSGSIVLSGVRLAPVLADFAALGVTDPGPVGPPDPFSDPDPSRGIIDARLSIAGITGAPESRTGRGVVRISGGDVLQIPLVLPMIQVSNLQLPSQDRIGYLQSELGIQGRRTTFENITLLSRSIAILGSGTMSLDDFALDMTFNSKGLSRVPMLSDLFEILRDEIVTTTVTGTVAKPEVSTRTFAGTRRLIDAVLNPGKQPAVVADLIAASRAAQQERDRLEAAAVGPIMPTEP